MLILKVLTGKTLEGRNHVLWIVIETSNVQPEKEAGSRLSVIRYLEDYSRQEEIERAVREFTGKYYWFNIKNLKQLLQQ